MSPGRYYNQSDEHSDQLADLGGAFKAKYMFSDDTDEKYKACQAYIAGQQNESNICYS